MGDSVSHCPRASGSKERDALFPPSGATWYFSWPVPVYNQQYIKYINLRMPPQMSELCLQVCVCISKPALRTGVNRDLTSCPVNVVCEADSVLQHQHTLTESWVSSPHCEESGGGGWCGEHCHLRPVKLSRMRTNYKTFSVFTKRRIKNKNEHFLFFLICTNFRCTVFSLWVDHIYDC